MHKLSKFLIAAAVVLVQGCGGGQAAVANDNTNPPQQGATLAFEVDYSPSVTALSPAGTVEISPVAGKMTIGTRPLAKVEFLLFGYEAQVLSVPNFQPKDNPQERYVFRLPSTFSSNSYQCGSGVYVSEVRATDVDGLSLSKTFELCKDAPFYTTASLR